MEPMPDALRRIEAELRSYDVRARRVLPGWRRACPALAASGVMTPSEVPRWVWGLGRDEADEVLRALVGLAQAGDEAALLAVLVCLQPGLRALVRRSRVSLAEVVSEAALRVLEVPLASRRTVAGGLVLDVRHRFWAFRRDQAVVTDPDDLSELVDASQASDDVVPAGETLLDLLSEACGNGLLSHDQARLVIETRMADRGITDAAASRSITKQAAYRRRERTERRLAWFYRAAA